MKKILAFLLCGMVAVGCMPMATLVASADTAFAMPNYFADNMMFQRNKDITLFGVSTPGKTILGEFYETNTTIIPVEKVSVTVGADGTWSLSFAPREGSYQHYRIVIYENNVVMRVIHTVYIGELWLAAGQSNMEYRLDWEKDGATEIANANDPYLRVLLMTGNPVGTAGTPLSGPTFDIHGAVWIDGANKTYIGSVSANAYYACKQLREKLDMPVGFINAPLGSTNIQTWLSRESIEGNGAVKSALQASNTYLTQAQAATKASDYRDMCAMYNTKVGPLAGMNLGGVIWCQGESNRDGPPNNDGFYKEAIGALASGYSKIFGYENGDMPVIVINIANQPYLNDPQNIPKWIEEISDAAEENPNIVSIPIYDVPLTYQNPPDPSVAYAIHPNTKKPGGTRAGLAAFHNFCKEGKGDYYAPTVSSYEVKDGAIYVTFNHAVEGLGTLNNSIGVHGFTIAGDDDLFLPASASVVSQNQVKVWNDSIQTPVHVTYAFNSHAQTANLCNSYGIPAVPFRSNRDMTRYFGSNDWMYCDDTTVFVNEGLTGNYQTIWQPSGPATLAIDTTTRYEGTGSVRLNYTLSSLGTASAVSTFGYYLMPFDLGNYQTISVMVKNPDARAKTIRFLVGKAGTNNLWSLPSATNPGVYEVTLPANSDFTKYTFAVANPQGYTTTDSLSWSQVNRIDVMVGDRSSGTIYVDGFSVGATPADLEPFTAYTENLAPIYHVGLTTATSADPTWKDYNYIGQEFVPQTETLSGVKLPLHLSSGKATLHLELRSTINGTAIAATDVELTSKGNSVAWYDISLGQTLSVKPYRTYYFVYYLTARDANSVCIAYGRDLGVNGATHYGFAWAMANGGTPKLTSSYNHLQFGFELITTPLASQEELDKAAAKEVMDLIIALPAEITLQDEEQVKAAAKAYKALTQAQKDLVTNYALLTAAQGRISELKIIEENKAVAKTVVDLINALPATLTLGDESQLNAANKAYNNLTEAQKEFVTNLDKLIDAKAQMASLKAGEIDKLAAKEVMDLIAALPQTITLDHQEMVVTAREGYNGLTDLQKDLVTNITILTAAEATIANLKQEIADKAAAQVVIDMIDALPQTITLSDKDAIRAATEAYAALTKAQQAYVTNLEILNMAEQRLGELENTTPVYGDLNGDEKVDAKDALLILKYTVGKAELTEEQLLLADVYQNEKVDAKDALYVLRYSVQKEESLPVIPNA